MSQALSPGEAAELLGVHVKTITRYANDGRLPYFRTPGGHRRYLMADVLRFRDPQIANP